MAFDRLDSVGLSYLWGKIKAAFATKSQVGDTAMGTTATTVTGAIKEHSDLIGSASMGTTASTLTGAIAEHETDINNLNSNLNNKSQITIVSYEKTLGALNSNTDYSGSINVSKTGWSAYGVIGFYLTGTYYSHFHVSSFTITNWNTLSYSIRANSSSSFTTDSTKLCVKILYVKS